MKLTLETCQNRLLIKIVSIWYTSDTLIYFQFDQKQKDFFLFQFLLWIGLFQTKYTQIF